MSDAPRRFVLAFARSPTPGQTKTRLARTEGAHEAARIYSLLARDVWQTLIDEQVAGRCEVALCLPPGDAPWLGGAAHVWSQGDGDLGAKMGHCLQRAFDAGATEAVVVGTDVVGLDRGVLERAFMRLQQADVVIAPTPDGGYGLIGMRALQPAVLDGMPWSTSRVTHETRRRARAAGLDVLGVGGLRDVDVAADLEGVVPTLSILIPALNEAPRLAAHLPALLREAEEHRGDVELIVIDGGSADDSLTVARAAGARGIGSARGRGVQLAAGAAAARGRWLWTVHADAAPQPGAVAGALRFCRRDRQPWGFTPTRIAHASPLLRVVNTFAEYRASLLRLPYGDQGILVKRAVFDHVGGYDRVPLMEDVLLARRLRVYGPPGRVPAQLEVDARRWRHHGILRTTWMNWSTLARFLVLGTDPKRLATGYNRGSSG